MSERGSKEKSEQKALGGGWRQMNGNLRKFSLRHSVSSNGQQPDERSTTLALGKGVGAPRAAVNHK